MKNFLSSDVAPPTPQPNGKVMLDAWTGMRFVAAICVFLVHFQWMARVEMPGARHLWHGVVGFFFMLSGFVLTHVYPSGIPATNLARYFSGRSSRIWPVHFACVALVLFVFRDRPLPHSAHDFASLAATCLLVQTWIVDMPTMIQFNGVAWSLSVEVFLYALFPFLGRLDNRRFCLVTGGVACLTAMGLVVGERLASGSGPGLEWAKHAAHFTPPMRLLEFLLGMAAARWFARLPAVGPRRPVRDTLVDLLATGMVAAGFLVFGQKVGSWRGASPESLRSPSNTCAAAWDSGFRLSSRSSGSRDPKVRSLGFCRGKFPFGWEN